MPVTAAELGGVLPLGVVVTVPAIVAVPMKPGSETAARKASTIGAPASGVLEGGAGEGEVAGRACPRCVGSILFTASRRYDTAGVTAKLSGAARSRP